MVFRCPSSGLLSMPSPSSLRRALGLLVALLPAACGPPAVNCELTMVAQMPLEVQDQLLIVPAGINGKWVRLIVDTGAERTTIADAAAERLGMPHDARYRTQSMGVGGQSTTTDVSVDRLVLGGVRFPLQRVAVGNFNLQNENGLNADGLLGADILLAFDLDIDVAGARLTLYRPRICPQAPLPWQEPAAEIAGVRAQKDRLLVPFALDGVAGMAIIDTGAQRSVLGLDMARRMNLNSQTMAGDPVIHQHGVGPDDVIAHIHRFDLLRIGPVTQRDLQLPVMETEAGLGDALIGQEFLRGRRVWISFRDRQIYVSQHSSVEP
jgi:predicted aspartyl protease